MEGITPNDQELTNTASSSNSNMEMPDMTSSDQDMLDMVQSDEELANLQMPVFSKNAT